MRSSGFSALLLFLQPQKVPELLLLLASAPFPTQSSSKGAIEKFRTLSVRFQMWRNEALGGGQMLANFAALRCVPLPPAGSEPLCSDLCAHLEKKSFLRLRGHRVIVMLMDPQPEGVFVRTAAFTPPAGGLGGTSCFQLTGRGGSSRTNGPSTRAQTHQQPCSLLGVKLVQKSPSPISRELVGGVGTGEGGVSPWGR